MARKPRLIPDPSVSPVQNRVRRQESGIAKDVGGSTTPGSGNKWYSKGDVKSAEFLIEAKRTDNMSQISLKLSDLEKIQVEALMERKMPALQIEYGTGAKYAVIPWNDFLALGEK